MLLAVSFATAVSPAGFGWAQTENYPTRPVRVILTSSPSVLTVHPSLPVRSVRELLALAKSRPGDTNYASAGVGTNPHIIKERGMRAD